MRAKRQLAFLVYTTEEPLMVNIPYSIPQFNISQKPQNAAKHLANSHFTMYLTIEKWETTIQCVSLAAISLF